jgi:uncharacterized protein
MRPAIAFLALTVSACGASTAEPIGEVPINTSPLGADSCALGRPELGGVATAAEKAVFAYDANAPLNLKKALESTSGGVEVSTISFDSPDGGTVTGLLFDPVTRSSLRPGIVLMHGAPGNARQMAGQGQALAAHGAVVVAIDAPFARRSSGQWRQFTSQDRTEQIQLMKDLQRAVDVLRARPNVDAARVAFIGVSYGGAMGVQFVGIERRLKAAVLEVADGGLVSHETSPGEVALASLSCAARVAWFKAMIPIEPIRFIAHASPTPLLLQSGRLDLLVPQADAEALHSAAPEPKTIRWYDAGHALGTQALIDRHEWLNAQIGLDILKL